MPLDEMVQARLKALSDRVYREVHNSNMGAYRAAVENASIAQIKFRLTLEQTAELERTFMFFAHQLLELH